MFLFCLCTLYIAEVLWKVHVLEGAFSMSLDEKYYCSGQLVSLFIFRKSDTFNQI